LNQRINRGDIFWIDITKQNGIKILTKRHPCIVVQNDWGNNSSGLTIIALCTSTIDRVYSHDCILEAKEGGLPTRTRICCNQLMTVEQIRLEDKNRIGKIPSAKIPLLNKALKFSLQFSP